MSAPVPLEERLLASAERVLTDQLPGRGAPHPQRLEVLEAAATLLGGLELPDLRATDDVERELSVERSLAAARPVVEALRRTPMHPALALAALARGRMARNDQRVVGAYYTDFRLARFLAERAVRRHEPGQLVVDPASGTGGLLVATALAACHTAAERDLFVSVSAHAADLSSVALRAVKLSLASLTSDPSAVAALCGRLRQIDSLDAGVSAWDDVAPSGFDTVIGNPPWEKLKVTRHELAASRGEVRHYGAGYDHADLDGLDEAREEVRGYASRASQRFGLAGGGEIDLYRLFLALATELAAPGGQLAMLVPAGLIRAHGTRSLRRFLLDRAPELQITVLHNRARFFAIDTRFKFLAVHAGLGDEQTAAPLLLQHAEGSPDGIDVTGRAMLNRAELERVRPDLTVPEVRSAAEWELFRRMVDRAAAHATERLPAQPIVRELDMTRDRLLFERERSPGALPLIEGRMVQAFRHAAKAYVSGTGRSARWDINPVGASAVEPQFWVLANALAPELAARVRGSRVGFCDITGQTNERAMLAARIPAGMVCGNKVPTLHFEDDDSADLWLALVNSLAFDWLLRRVVTTSVNYFVLGSVPLPALAPGSPTGRRLVEIARAVDAAYHGRGTGTERDLWRWRAELDAQVLLAYGAGPADAALVLADFPLLDRAQVPLPGEPRSTVTRDVVLQAVRVYAGLASDTELDQRVADALLLGAIPYVPAEMARTRRAPPLGVTA